MKNNPCSSSRFARDGDARHCRAQPSVVTSLIRQQAGIAIESCRSFPRGGGPFLVGVVRLPPKPSPEADGGRSDSGRAELAGPIKTPSTPLQWGSSVPGNPTIPSSVWGRDPEDQRRDRRSLSRRFLRTLSDHRRLSPPTRSRLHHGEAPIAGAHRVTNPQPAHSRSACDMGRGHEGRGSCFCSRRFVEGGRGDP